MVSLYVVFFFFSSRRRHTRLQGEWSSDVCSSDLTDATPAKESVPCTCDRDQTHIDTSGSSSTGHSDSLLVRGRRGGTAGTAGRDSPASGTPLIDPISCAVRLRRRRSVRSPWPRPDPAPAPCRFASG